MSVLSFLLVLGCCSWGTADEPDVPLWIVTEKTPDNGINGILRDAVAAFSASHANVSVRLEILPTGTRSRAERIAQLRELMAKGEGPDVLVLPASHTVYTGEKFQAIEPLFSSVPYAMREGLFRDISRYYDTDESLNRGALQQTVMDAGCVKGERLLLPLSFDMNVFYFLSDGEDAELRTDMTALEVLEYGLRRDDPTLAWLLTHGGALRYRPETVFSSLIDYDTGNITLSFEEVERFFRVYQKLADGAEGSEQMRGDITLWSYLKTPSPKGGLLPCYVSGLSMAASFPALAAMEGKSLMEIPIRAINGAVTATVGYYGAVGAGCKYPKLAYEFLKTLLLPEYQWRVDLIGEPIWEEWPVLVGGSVEAVWAETGKKVTTRKSAEALESLEVSDSWITDLTDQITRAEFRVDINLAGALDQLNADE